MADFARVIATTLTKYLKEREPVILRNRKLTAMLKKKGRMTFNHSGRTTEWRVGNARASMQTYGDMDPVQYDRINRYAIASIGWAAYSIAEAYSKQESLMNKGPEAIVPLVSDIVKQLTEDLEEQFADELYVDSRLPGNSSRISGIETLFGGSYSSGKIFTNSGIYAGLSTVLGNDGGTHSGEAWPFGQSDVTYDYWTPPIWNYHATDWKASGQTWSATCMEVLRASITANRLRSSLQGQVDLIMLTPSMFDDVKEALSDKERIQVERDRASSLMVELGFADSIKFEGVEVTSEYGIPASTSNNDARQGYLFNTNKMELMSMQDRLFVQDGPNYDQDRKATKFSIDFFGQMKFASARHFGKYQAD